MSRWLFSVICFLFAAEVLGGPVSPKDSLRLLFGNAQGSDKVAFVSKIDINLIMSYPIAYLAMAEGASKIPGSSKEIKSILHLKKGIAYISTGWLDSALNNLTKAEIQFNELTDITNQIETKNFLAIAFIESQNYDAAESIALKGLEIASQVNHLEGTILFNRTLGWIAHEIGQTEKAQKYYGQVLSTITNSNLKPFRKANILNRIGQFYVSINSGLSRSILKESLRLSESSGYLPGKEDAMQGLALLFQHEKKYDSAGFTLYQIVLSTDGESNYRTISKCYYQLAEVEFLKKNWLASLSFLEKSNSLAGDSKKQKILNASLALEVHKQLGNQKEISEILNFQSELYNSVYRETTRNLLNSFEYQLKLEKARVDILLHEAEISRNRSIQILMVVLLLTLAMVAFLAYHRYRLKRKLTDELLHVNHLLEGRQKELNESHQKLLDANSVIASQNQQLLQINEGQDFLIKQKTTDLRIAILNLKRWKHDLESLIYKVSHDIRGPIARLLGLSNLAKMEAKDDLMVDYLSKISETAHHVNNILFRLQRVNEHNAYSIKIKKVNCNLLVEEVFQGVKANYPDAEIALINEVSTDFEVITDEVMLRQIIEILVDNSVKYRNMMPEIFSFVKVKLSTDSSSKCVLHVLDNGIGIGQQQIPMLFKPFSRLSNHSSVGLNLYSAKLMAEKIKSSLNLVKNKEGFTEFRLTIPLQELELAR